MSTKSKPLSEHKVHTVLYSNYFAIHVEVTLILYLQNQKAITAILQGKTELFRQPSKQFNEYIREDGFVLERPLFFPLIYYLSLDTKN